MVSVMAFTSRAPRLQTSADRYYRFFDEGQQIGVDLVLRFESALMQKYAYNDLAPWKYAELPKALGCADWFTARVTTLGELDDAMKAARASKTGAYIEIIGGKLDMPPALAFAHGRLKAMCEG
jgi:hypothetical protein